MKGLPIKKLYIGDDVIYNQGILSLSYPIERGIIKDFDIWEELIDHIYKNEIKRTSDDCPLFLTEPTFNPKSQRKKMSEILFETFNVPHLSIERDGYLAGVASGSTNFLSVDIGEGQMSITALSQNFQIVQCYNRQSFGGMDITDYLKNLFYQFRERFNSNLCSEIEIFKDIKQNRCYVAKNFKEEKAKFEYEGIEKYYELPDGKVITLGEELFIAPECLFNPSLIGSNLSSLDEFIINSIEKAPMGIKSNFYGSIVLSGGSTLFNGLSDRLEKEILLKSKTKCRVKIIAPPERKYSHWIGGSILSNLSSASDSWCSKEKYQENGISLIENRFII